MAVHNPVTVYQDITNITTEQQTSLASTLDDVGDIGKQYINYQTGQYLEWQGTVAGFVVTGSSGAVNVTDLSGAMDSSATKTQLTTVGGERNQVAVSVGTYIVDSESVDVFVNANATADIYGMVVDTADKLSSASGVFDSTSLDLSTNVDLSIELWFELASDNNGIKNVFAIGANGEADVQVSAWRDATNGDLQVQMTAENTAGATAWDTGAIDTNIDIGLNELIHLVMVHDRGTDMEVYVNGTLITTLADGSFTTGDTAGDVDISAATANDRIGIFTTLGNAHSQPGKFYSMKWWKAVLITTSEVSTLNQYGPGAYPSGVTSPDLVIDAVTDRANWTSSLLPELIEGTPSSRTLERAFDTNDYGAAEAITGNVVAAFDNWKRIKANSQGLVRIPSGVSYLSIYTKPAAAGTIDLIPV